VAQWNDTVYSVRMPYDAAYHTKDDRKSGIALIAGSLGGLLTMHVHPRGTATITDEAQAAHLAITSAAAHSLALVSMLLLFLGACGLAHRLNRDDRISFIAIVTYGFACVAVLIAAAVSGFVVPAIVTHMAHDAAVNAREWQIVMSGIFQINQGMAQIFSVASSTAIFLWSLAALRNRGLNRALAIYGCIAGLAIVVAIPAGLRLNVQGMAIVILAQALWFLATGVQMSRTAPEIK
jgi:hypothetical protein